MDYGDYDDCSVRLAVELINVYGTPPRAADGRDAAPLPDLAAFLRSHDMDDSGIEPGAEEGAQRLADRLHAVFTASEADAVAVINAVLTESRALPQISGHDAQDWHMHYYAAGARPLDRLAVTAAMGLASVLCATGVQRLGRCSSHTCADVYVDTSRNNRRRFCSDGCANRSHVAAHRARRREGG
ncbi:MAG TPA: CGNR zinc finger domain-containing protein [Euzebyales bacterium]|nr:CGNR zinc finger domain-containing protein [Euzebyales bacterium]